MTRSGGVEVLSPAVARAARAYTGLTLAGLARAAGVAYRTAFKLEKGGNISDESLARIVDVYRRCGIVLKHDRSGAVSAMEFGPRPDGRTF